jgi:hypothetical protein
MVQIARLMHQVNISRARSCADLSDTARSFFIREWLATLILYRWFLLLGRWQGFRGIVTHNL